MKKTHTTLLPHTPAPIHWRSTTFAAKFYGITYRGIMQWIERGRFASVGVQVFKDASGRWWVLMEDSESDLGV